MSGNTIIVDAATNITAEVDSERRLHTHSVTVSSGLDAAINGDQYIISPPIIELTSDGESALIYIKNDEPEQVDWVISLITIIANQSTGGSGDWFADFFANVNTGTIVDSGVDVPAFPLNLGSSKPLSATIKLGGEGLTFTGQAFTKRLVPSSPAEVQIPLDSVILPAGGSVGLSIEPPVGNTSMKFDISLTVERLTEE